MQVFKYVILLLLGTACLPAGVYANNISVSNLTLTGQSGSGSSAYYKVQFDVSWENSWRTSAADPYNWDAAWVFVKYRIGAVGNAWQHATLSTSAGDHTAPSGSTITPTSDGKGVFIYRNADGSGAFSLTGVQLRWNYGADGVSDTSQITIQATAIEMVYVPQASFYLGGGSAGGETSRFYSYTTSSEYYAYLVDSENAITVGTSANNLYYASSTYGGDQTGPIPAGFPKGYNAFYCMKYEGTQEQYVDFLNTLTFNQQSSRISASTSSTIGTNALTNNEILEITKVKTSGLIFGCDLSEDGEYNGSADGQTRPCNGLKWADCAAYLDWASLRPMTELEYEKACRGILNPVPNEYVWGSTTIYDDNSTIAFSSGTTGTTNETVTPTNTNCITSAWLLKAVRVGCFAKSSSTRESAGATYYGIMEMSGNVWEFCISAGNSTGRGFTGIHGDGALDSSGNANVTNWPGTDAVGIGIRGSGFDTMPSYARLSDRICGTYTASSSRARSFGFRGVRTAP